jgi:hypothetical protein
MQKYEVEKRVMIRITFLHLTYLQLLAQPMGDNEESQARPSNYNSE